MMKGGMRFAQSQSQSQQFNLQMRQALTLLQMPAIELSQEIASQVSDNPLLDAVYPPAVSAPPASGGPVLFGPAARPAASADGFERETRAAAETLADHLLAQLAFAPLDAREKFLGETLIGEIEPDGYLRADLTEIATRLGAAPGTIEGVLAVLQTFEPTGVFARNLAECLALQLAERDRLDPLMRGLLDRLELVGQMSPDKVAANLRCTREDLDDMLAELRTLDPRPGLQFGFEPPVAVLPEVRVAQAQDGSWTVESWAPHLPRVVVRKGKFERLAQRCHTEDDVRYLKERLVAARRFSDLLARRGRTVLEVAAEIVKRQEAFLTEGVSGLKPLMLKTVADALDMHESTVSRAVADKAMLTPRGVLPFKAFFAAAAATADGSDLTQAHVIARIGAIIAGEPKTGQVLSDDAIAEQLTGEGIRIARRTVAKHREGLGLPTAVQRRAALGRGPAPAAPKPQALASAPAPAVFSARRERPAQLWSRSPDPTFAGADFRPAYDRPDDMAAPWRAPKRLARSR
jgi:RNA polymerase sigma-54 factor